MLNVSAVKLCTVADGRNLGEENLQHGARFQFSGGCCGSCDSMAPDDGHLVPVTDNHAYTNDSCEATGNIRF
jgi:hypothetical protein